jgi:hypothetical protein
VGERQVSFGPFRTCEGGAPSGTNEEETDRMTDTTEVASMIDVHLEGARAEIVTPPR